MLVTEVEMLLWHPKPAEMAKMADWLRTHEKFLFDTSQRVSYGLHILNADWQWGDVRVDCKSRSGPYIDL